LKEVRSDLEHGNTDLLSLRILPTSLDHFLDGKGIREFLVFHSFLYGHGVPFRYHFGAEFLGDSFFHHGKDDWVGMVAQDNEDTDHWVNGLSDHGSRV
jgi:hypothetical protein